MSSKRSPKLFIRKYVFQSLLLIFFITAGIFAGTYLVKNRQSVRSDATEFVEKRCLAGTYTALTSCFAKMQTKEINVIEITDKILCDSKNICNFKISGITNAKIVGTAGKSVGFVRNGYYKSSVITIENSTNITLSNIYIDDNKSLPWCVYPDSTCKSQIRISYSDTALLDNVLLLNSKAQAITTNATKKFSFINSRLANTFLQGIWMSDMDGVYIINSRFNDTYGSALFLAGSNIEVTGNLFQHNQWNPPWKIQGGQVNVAGVNTALFANNTIENGSYLNHVTPGLEFDVKWTNTNVTIRGNIIRNNTGWGIVKGASTVINNVLIENNTLSNNYKPMIWDFEGKNLWTLKNNLCDGIACTVTSIGPTPTPIPTSISITKIGFNKTFNPWALWMTGVSLNDNVKVKLFYNNVQWGSDLPLNFNEDSYFGTVRLPSNTGPSNCNKYGDCLMTAVAVDGTSKSPAKTFYLPKY